MASSPYSQGWSGQLQFYLLVPLLRKEATLIDLQLNLVEEQLLLRYRRKTYKFLHEKTTELWDKLEEGTIITPDFLKEIGHLYAPS